VGRVLRAEVDCVLSRGQVGAPSRHVASLPRCNARFAAGLHNGCSLSSTGHRRVARLSFFRRRGPLQLDSTLLNDDLTPMPAGCEGCRNAEALDFEFTMAFQPIVDASNRTVYAHEALVRGPGGESAFSILARVDANNRYAFDQACRVRAIELATSLGMQSKLSINFLPNAVYRPEACIRTTLSAAQRCGFPLTNIMFELTEDERATDLTHLASIFDEYGRHGFVTAIDDFGAGYAGLELLAAFQPHVIKIDMGLVRDVNSHRPRRSIVSGIIGMCTELGITVIAEGVETVAEFQTLRALGISLFQGYLFARPALRALPAIDWSALDA